MRNERELEEVDEHNGRVVAKIFKRLSSKIQIDVGFLGQSSNTGYAVDVRQEPLQSQIPGWILELVEIS